jgi:hypothetical protein
MESIFVLVVLFVMALSLPLVGAWWIGDWSRGLLRNRNGQCAICAASLGTEDADSYLIQGREACSACARRMQRQLPVQLTVLAIAVGVATALGLTAAANLTSVDAAGWMITLGAMLGFGGSAVAALKGMKWMNRRALGPSADLTKLLDEPFAETGDQARLVAGSPGLEEVVTSD